MFERRSALAGVMTESGRDGADGHRRLRIGESRGRALVQAAAFATTSAGFDHAIRSVLNHDLPAKVGVALNVDGRRLLKTGADQYWILTRESDDILPALQKAVTSGIGAITSLSHSRTCIFLEGAAAREVLAKGVPIDFHPEVFRVDQFALTGLDHIPVLIYRRHEHLYELYAMRTFALSVWEWITDAALPFGYHLPDGPHEV